MRSRPSIKVFLKPGVPHPGDKLEVEAHFEAKTETPVTQVTFDLKGVERVTVQRGKSTVQWKHDHFHLRAEQEGKTFSPGIHTYRATFPLPVTLPPLYQGRYCSVDYVIEVRAHIPWWPDSIGRYNVPIAQLPLNAESKPAVFVSEYGGPQGDDLYAELSLASTVVEPGEVIRGTVAFSNGSKERGVRVALVAFENLHADAGFWAGGSIRETLDVRRWTHTLTNMPPPEGIGLPFEFAVAPNTIPSFEGKIGDLRWAIEVLAERTFSNRTILRAPILIVPKTRQSRANPQMSAPAVGLKRKFESFQRVGARLGLTYDKEQHDLRGSSRAIGFRIAAETNADGAPATVAHLSWPSLGMDLRVGPTSWTDWMGSHRVETQVPEFQKKFTAQSRVTGQAEALLDQSLCIQLARFNDVRLNDEGATFLVPMSLVDERPLGDFVEQVLRVAAELNLAFERIPLPPSLVEHGGAWRAFANRLGGRFEPGRGAIFDATFALERVEIVTSWSDDGKYATTRIRMPLGSRVDTDAISPAAQKLVDALSQESGTKANVTSDSVDLHLDRLVTDPASLEPLLEGLLRLTQTLRGRGAAGPFRS